MPKATSAETSAKLTMPTEVVGEIQRKMQERSVIASLVPSRAEAFVNQEHMIFTVEPEAEFVGEGAAKNSAAFAFEPIEGKRHKVQTTVRMTDEFTWADEDNQLAILDNVFDSMAGAFSRALDYGMIHAINPLTREVLSTLKTDALAYTANQLAATTDKIADMDSIADLILPNYDVNGIALDRMYANDLRKIRIPSTGARQYPEIGLTLDPGTIDGLRAVTSAAVSGQRLAALDSSGKPVASGIKAIVGDWNLIRYGIVRDFALTEIRYGDPDGLGDLQRYNQVAFRVETVFSWVNFDPKGFTVLRDSSTIPSDDGGDDGGDDDDNGTETQSAKAKAAAK